MRAQLLRFAGAGLAGLAADVSVLYLALACGSGFYLGRLLSFLVAVWVTWQINRRYTFSAAGGVAAATWREWWRYLMAMSFGGAVNYGVSSVVVMLAHAQPLPALLLPAVPLCAVAAGTLAGMTLNFLSAKFFVFQR